MRFTTRQLVLMAVFGTIWGAVEISLGSLIKSFNLPLGGQLLATVGLTIAMIGRVFVPQRGATLFTGVVAMLLKLFSLGGVTIGPMIGIFAEALIVEVVLSLLGQPRRVAFLIAGSLGVLWTLIQPFFTGLLLFGREPFIVWLDLLDEGRRLFSLNIGGALWIVLAMVALHLMLGSLAGWLAWDAGHRLRARQGRPIVTG